MSEKKNVSPFQFKKVSKAFLQSPKQQENPITNVQQPIINYQPTSDAELIQNLNDKETLTTQEEKFQVIDYVFRKDSRPVQICYCCGNSAGTQYFVSHSEKKDIHICHGCFQSLGVCDNCGLPTQQSGPKLPSLYCQYCKVTRVCDCCGTSITAKESNRIPSVKGTFCSHCFKDVDRCHICQIPVTVKNRPIKDESLCLACHSRKISSKMAYQLNKVIISMLNKLFDIQSNIKCEVKLLPYAVLNPDDINTPIKQGRFANISGKRVLALYQHITKERAMGIFAYEYAKYLLQRLNSDITDKTVIEGFALWAKSYILRELCELDELHEIKSFFQENSVLKSLWNIERLGGVSRIAEKIRKGEITKK